MLVIDYLNLGLLKYIINLSAGSKVYVAFRSRNRIIERLLEKLITYKGCSVIYVKFSAAKTYAKHTKLADEVADLVRGRLGGCGELGNYFRMRVGYEVFTGVYRAAAIIEFINADAALKSVKQIFISQLSFKNEFREICSDDKVKLYHGLGKPDDFGCMPMMRPWRMVGLSSVVYQLAYLLYTLLVFVPRGWPKGLVFDAIFYLPPKTNDRRNYSHDVVVSSVESYCELSDDFKLEFCGRRFLINRISLLNLLEYIKHFVVGAQLFGSIEALSMAHKAKLLNEWVKVYFIKKMLVALNPKVVYSANENLIAHLLHIACAENDSCVALVSTYSGGYFPVRNEMPQTKFADVFFAWGQYHSDLYMASVDCCKYHVISGYVGDIHKNDFENGSKKMFSEIVNSGRPILALYDTTFADDLFVDRDSYYRFVDVVVAAAEELGALVVLKVKKNSSLYGLYMDKYKGTLKIYDEKASFAPSVDAALVVSYLSTTPALVSGAWGRRVAIYDPYEMMWDKVRNLIGGSVVNSEIKLISCIHEAVNDYKLTKANNSDAFSVVDPFADGNAQHRIAEYISSLMRYMCDGKEFALTRVNDEYMDKYGKDMVINNKLMCSE